MSHTMLYKRLEQDSPMSSLPQLKLRSVKITGRSVVIVKLPDLSGDQHFSKSGEGNKIFGKLNQIDVKRDL